MKKSFLIAATAIMASFLFETNTANAFSLFENLNSCLEKASKAPTPAGVGLAARTCHQKYPSKEAGTPNFITTCLIDGPEPFKGHFVIEFTRPFIGSRVDFGNQTFVITKTTADSAVFERGTTTATITKSSIVVHADGQRPVYGNCR